MADLTASDLTYTILDRGKTSDGRQRVVAKIATGSGDYPTGGLPLTKGKLGCPSHLESLIIVEPSAADNYQYVFDRSAEKIKVIVDDGTSGVPAEHGNAAFTSPDELIVEAVGW